MSSLKKMNYEVPNHGKYLFPSFETITKLKFKKWEYNREPVACKIDEITDIILKNKRCEGVICVAKINGKYNCYDGWHRYSAIHKSLELNPDLKSCTVILFVLKDTKNEELNKVNIIEHFKELNKCDPVSEIFYEDPNSKKRRIVEATRQYYHSNFKKFFTTSQNPRVPNENISRFDTRLTCLYEEKKPESFNDFKKILDEMSSRNRFKSHLMSNPTLTKCTQHNFFLFSIKNWHLE